MAVGRRPASLAVSMATPMAALVMTCATPVCAQDKVTSAPDPVWALSLGAGRTTNALGAASERSMSLRRSTEWGPVVAEGLQLHRLGQTDHAWALDAYPRLWEKAYANVRWQQASQALLYPGTSWRAELYQGVGTGWEWSVSHDHLGFESPVHIEGVAIGKYWGNFFVRWRHQQVHSKGASGQGDRFLVRYYYQGDADHYLEANASSGRSDDFVTTWVAASRSDTRGMSWLHFFNKDWGLKASLSESKDASRAGARERSAHVGLTRRW